MTIPRVLLAGVGAAAATLSALIMVAGPAGASAAAVSGPSAAASGCDAGAWGTRVQGQPANFQAGNRGGDYLWHDKNGFHLRVTHRGDDRALYTGEIDSPAAMRIDPVALEKGDTATLSADRKSLFFTFANYGRIDGVNFHTDCAASITAKYLTVGNNKLPTNRVYLGAHELHPAAIPFTIHRTDQH